MAWTPYIEVVYDDAVCKVEIVESAHMRGVYFIVVDDDPEHHLGTMAVGRDEADIVAHEVRVEFEDTNGQQGVGA